MRVVVGFVLCFVFIIYLGVSVCRDSAVLKGNGCDTRFAGETFWNKIFSGEVANC